MKNRILLFVAFYFSLSVALANNPIEVSTTKEFISAIGSDRTIVITAESLDLSVEKIIEEFGIYFDEQNKMYYPRAFNDNAQTASDVKINFNKPTYDLDGYGMSQGYLILEDVKNCTITSSHPKGTVLYSSGDAKGIIAFLFADNVSLNNIHFDFYENTETKGVMLASCNNVTFNDCQFKGNAQTAVSILGGEDIVFNKPIFSNYSKEVLTVFNANNIRLNDALFADNNCTEQIVNNTLSNVIFNNATFRDNKAAKLLKEEYGVIAKNVQLTTNEIASLPSKKKLKLNNGVSAHALEKVVHVLTEFLNQQSTDDSFIEYRFHLLSFISPDAENREQLYLKFGKTYTYIAGANLEVKSTIEIIDENALLLKDEMQLSLFYNETVYTKIGDTSKISIANDYRIDSVNSFSESEGGEIGGYPFFELTNGNSRLNEGLDEYNESLEELIGSVLERGNSDLDGYSLPFIYFVGDLLEDLIFNDPDRPEEKLTPEEISYFVSFLEDNKDFFHNDFKKYYTYLIGSNAFDKELDFLFEVFYSSSFNKYPEVRDLEGEYNIHLPDYDSESAKQYFNSNFADMFVNYVFVRYSMILNDALLYLDDDVFSLPQDLDESYKAIIKEGLGSYTDLTDSEIEEIISVYLEIEKNRNGFLLLFKDIQTEAMDNGRNFSEE